MGTCGSCDVYDPCDREPSHCNRVCDNYYCPPYSSPYSAQTDIYRNYQIYQNPPPVNPYFQIDKNK